MDNMYEAIKLYESTVSLAKELGLEISVSLAGVRVKGLILDDLCFDLSDARYFLKGVKIERERLKTTAENLAREIEKPTKRNKRCTK